MWVGNLYPNRNGVKQRGIKKKKKNRNRHPKGQHSKKHTTPPSYRLHKEKKQKGQKEPEGEKGTKKGMGA